MRSQQLANLTQSGEGFNFPAIGVVLSSYHDRRGTPRQSSLASSSKQCRSYRAYRPSMTISHFIFFEPTGLSVIRFQTDISASFEEITLGLDGYSHLWIVFTFHQNTNFTRRQRQPDVKSSPRTSCYSTEHYSRRPLIEMIVHHCGLQCPVAHLSPWFLFRLYCHRFFSEPSWDL